LCLIYLFYNLQYQWLVLLQFFKYYIIGYGFSQVIKEISSI